MQNNLSKAQLLQLKIGTIGPVVKVDDPRKSLGAGFDTNKYSGCSYHHYPLLRKP